MSDDFVGVARDASTILDVLRDFEADGFSGQFTVHGHGVQCVTCRHVTDAHAAAPLRSRRLEGASDPDDMLMVLAFVCESCATKGTVVVNYGPEATPADVALMSSMDAPPPPLPEEISNPDADREARDAVDAVGRRVDLRALRDVVGRSQFLDQLGGTLGQLSDRIPRRARSVLRGAWLGHPLHPALTDRPIGFWTSAFVIDLVGDQQSRPVADGLVGLGVLSAIPTMLSGAADWPEGPPEARRVAVGHAGADISATALCGWSFFERRRGRRSLGVARALAGATAARLGAFLGGDLAVSSE
jgi:hypothetical protein